MHSTHFFNKYFDILFYLAEENLNIDDVDNIYIFRQYINNIEKYWKKILIYILVSILFFKYMF